MGLVRALPVMVHDEKLTDKTPPAPCPSEMKTPPP